jgi:hypothetical protein
VRRTPGYEGGGVLDAAVAIVGGGGELLGGRDSNRFTGRRNRDGPQSWNATTTGAQS